MNLQFGDFLLLREERRLRGPGGTVELGDRSCDVLCALLEASGQVVTKQALMDAVWHGVVVEENTLQVHVSTLRKALGPLHIQTVHGRGYKYVGPRPLPWDAGPDRDGPGLADLSSLERTIRGKDSKKTSVAVLPFSTATDDRDCLLLADGLVEDLITELASYRHISVIGNRISSQYREPGNARDAIARDLGVDFVIDGSIRAGPGAIRVAVQLVDAETGAVAWGDRFSREPGDVFAVQDEIVGAVVARLAFNIDEAAERQRRRDPTSSDSAYVQFLRARAHWRNGAALSALECALRAIEIDPDYGRANAYVAYFHAFGRFGQWFGLSLSELDARTTLAIERALAVDPTDPFILQRASMAFLMRGDPAAALRYAEAAALQSALDSEILVIRGLTLAFCGRKEEGAESLERAIALEPRLAPGCYSALAEVRHMQRDYCGSQAMLETVPNPPVYIELLKRPTWQGWARLMRREGSSTRCRTITIVRSVPGARRRCAPWPMMPITGGRASDALVFASDGTRMTLPASTSGRASPFGGHGAVFLRMMRLARTAAFAALHLEPTLRRNGSSGPRATAL